MKVGVRHHDLKTHADAWAAVDRRDKKAEFRKDDRKFAVGDILWLHEVVSDVPDGPVRQTGRCLTRIITDIRKGGNYGIPEGFAMLSMRPVTQEDLA